MPNFDEYKCPVCSQQFDNSDDIVTCPVCGTPHHRHCYELTGHCVNKGLHSAGYDYYEDNKPVIAPQTNNNSQYYIPPTVDANAKDEGTRTIVMPLSSATDDEKYDNIEQTIGDVKVSDYAATIRTNVPRFLAKFKQMNDTKKRVSWNWGAFFFGSFYLLFRKMYKQGITFLLLSLTVFMGGEMMLTKMAPVYTKAVQDMIMSSNGKDMSSVDITALANASDIMVAQKVVYLTMISLLIIRLVVALFADYFYKNSVTSIIKRVTTELENGASFMQTPMMPVEDNNLSQKQMKKLYLGRLGGVSFFAPFAAYFAIYLLVSFL